MPRQDGSGSGRQAKKPVTVAEVTEILAAGDSQLNMSTLATTMLTNFGGMTRFAEEFRRAYDESKPGSIARQKMLEGLMRVVNLAAPKANPSDLTNLSDADLHRTIEFFLKKLASHPGDNGAAQEKETSGPLHNGPDASVAGAGPAADPAPAGHPTAG